MPANGGASPSSGDAGACWSESTPIAHNCVPLSADILDRGTARPTSLTVIVRKTVLSSAMTKIKAAPDELTIRPLSNETWDAFADLGERHNGVWGGCWCTWFHTMTGEKERDADANRALKERLVDEGRAHAALVFHDEVAVGWCQYGVPAELPNINHRKEYEQLVQQLPTTG